MDLFSFGTDFCLVLRYSLVSSFFTDLSQSGFPCFLCSWVLFLEVILVVCFLQSFRSGLQSLIPAISSVWRLFSLGGFFVFFSLFLSLGGLLLFSQLLSMIMMGLVGLWGVLIFALIAALSATISFVFGVFLFNLGRSVRCWAGEPRGCEWELYSRAGLCLLTIQVPGSIFIPFPSRSPGRSVSICYLFY